MCERAALVALGLEDDEEEELEDVEEEDEEHEEDDELEEEEDDELEGCPKRKVGRPRATDGKDSNKNYRVHVMKKFDDALAAKRWRNSLEFKIRAGGNNKHRTIWKCKSHETLTGEECPWEAAAFKVAGGGVEYWQGDEGREHGAKTKQRKDGEDGIDQRWLPFVDSSVRGGMTPANIRSRIIVQVNKDAVLQKTIPDLKQVRTPSRSVLRH